MLTLLPLLALLSAPAHANSTGITGRSTSGCGSCHGSAAATSTTATLSATSTTLAPGASTNVMLRVATTSTTRTHAGLNAAASGGTLSAGTNTVKVGTQITHSAPQAMTSRAITFRFRWTAPTTPGTYTITAAGNAVNNNGASSGDGWRVASALTMTVSSAFAGDDAAEQGEDDVVVLEQGDLEEVMPELDPDTLAAIDAWEDGAAAEGLEGEDGYVDPAELDGLGAEDEAEVDLAACSTTGSAPAAGFAGLALGAALVSRRRRQA